jgi:DNA repair protein RadC
MLGGTDNLEPHEVLELALFYAIPRKNTNEIAHRLLKKFGSIAAIFDAPIGMLKEVKDIGESAALFIKLIPEISRVYLEDKYNVKRKILNFNEMCGRLVLKFVGRMEETIAVMLFDAKGKIVYDGILSKGTINAVDLYSRRLIELIMLYNSVSLILAHNHPSGFAVPSADDLSSTKKLNRLLANMNVSFLDHIIVADNEFVSIRDSGMADVFEL